MEYLALAALAILLFWSGVRLGKRMRRNYSFDVFSLGAVAKLLGALIVWVLAYYFYKPGSAASSLVEAGAASFVYGAGIGLPLWLWVKNIKASNIFWGTLAFIYQAVFAATVGIILVFFISHLDDD